MADRLCEAPLSATETCRELASWIVEDEAWPGGEMALCQAHNDYDLEHNSMPNPRRGVWEGQGLEGEPIARQETAPPAGLTWEDFQGWLLQWVARGASEGMLLRQAQVAISQRAIAEARWVSLEYARERSAPLWLAEREAQKLVQMLRGMKGVEARKIRQAVEDLFA